MLLWYKTIFSTKFQADYVLLKSDERDVITQIYSIWNLIYFEFKENKHVILIYNER